MKELKIAAENNYKTFESMLKSIDFKEELKIATVTEVKNYLSKKKPITFKEDDDDFNENHSQDLIVLRVEYQDNDLKRLKEKIVANILKKFDVTNKDIYFWENPTEEIKKCFEYCYGYWNKKKKLLEDYIKRRYLYNNSATMGFYSGLRLVNKYGFTTQNSAIYEFYTNKATTKQRTLIVDERKIIIYKPFVAITKNNINELEFLELMRVLYKYSEINEKEIKKELNKYIQEKNIDFNKVKKLISYYPSIVYKNLYRSGIIIKCENV